MELRNCYALYLVFYRFDLVLQNQGEEISLRLRTDDLKGFRKYQSIKKTLLHELVSFFFVKEKNIVLFWYPLHCVSYYCYIWMLRQFTN